MDTEPIAWALVAVLWVLGGALSASVAVRSGWPVGFVATTCWFAPVAFGLISGIQEAITRKRG